MKKKWFVEICIISVIAVLRIAKQIRFKREMKKLEELNEFVNIKGKEMNDCLKESFAKQKEDIHNYMKNLRYRIMITELSTGDSFQLGSSFTSFDEALDVEMWLFNHGYSPLEYNISVKRFFIEEE